MMGGIFILAAQVGQVSPPAPVIFARPIPPSKPWYDHLSLQDCAVVDAQGKLIRFYLTVAERRGKIKAMINGGEQFGLKNDGFVDASNTNVKTKGISTLRTVKFVNGENQIVVRQLLSGQVVQKTSFLASHQQLKPETAEFEYLAGFCFDGRSAPEVKQ